MSQNEETHYSTDRFCGNNLGVNGIRQPIISYSKVTAGLTDLKLNTSCAAFQLESGDGQGRDLGQHRLHEQGLPPEVPPAVLQQPVGLSSVRIVLSRAAMRGSLCSY